MTWLRVSESVSMEPIDKTAHVTVVIIYSLEAFSSLFTYSLLSDSRYDITKYKKYFIFSIQRPRWRHRGLVVRRCRSSVILVVKPKDFSMLFSRWRYLSSKTEIGNLFLVRFNVGQLMTIYHYYYIKNNWFLYTINQQSKVRLDITIF